MPSALAKQNKQNVQASEKLNLTTIRLFGVEADRLGLPHIADGGFILPGYASASDSNPGKEKTNNGEREQAGKEAGPAARPWQRPSSEAAETGPSAHAVGSVEAAILEQLCDYGAGVTVVHSSPRFVYLEIGVGLFYDL